MTLWDSLKVELLVVAALGYAALLLVLMVLIFVGAVLGEMVFVVFLGAKALAWPVILLSRHRAKQPRPRKVFREGISQSLF